VVAVAVAMRRNTIVPQCDMGLLASHDQQDRSWKHCNHLMWRSGQAAGMEIVIGWNMANSSMAPGTKHFVEAEGCRTDTKPGSTEVGSDYSSEAYVIVEEVDMQSTGSRV